MPSSKKKKGNSKVGKVTKKLSTSNEGVSPKECSVGEYKELLSMALSLTTSEAQTEFLDCARYGELDPTRALLEVWIPKCEGFVNYTDDSGSTALHKASANGHVKVVRLLLLNKASHFANSSGDNSPLHWAAANGHESVVEAILKHYDPSEIDVLAKNKGGRSALTEGFSSKNTKLVGMLLEHDSAEEEKLLGNAKEVDPQENKKDHNSSKSAQDDLDESEGLIHEFNLLRDGSNDGKEEKDQSSSSVNNDDAQTLLIRELPIKNADSPFGDDAIDDTTGLGIWCASLVMARWMATKSMFGRFDNKSVLELGAGCGVPGLAVGLYGNAKNVYITDYNPATMKNLQYNIDLNTDRLKSSIPDWVEKVNAMAIDWDNENTWPAEKMDVVIGSDLIYQKSIVPLLKKVINGLLKRGGTFLYSCPTDGRDGLPQFLDVMKKEGFKCEGDEIAPDLYRTNPLSNGDAGDAFLHFYELPVTEYKLFEFRKL